MAIKYSNSGVPYWSLYSSSLLYLKHSGGCCGLSGEVLRSLYSRTLKANSSDMVLTYTLGQVTQSLELLEPLGMQRSETRNNGWMRAKVSKVLRDKEGERRSIYLKNFIYYLSIDWF